MEEGLWKQTLLQLRTCGQGHRECAVYWTGPAERPGLVDEVLHPEHTSSRSGYEISSSWLRDIWERLGTERRSIRAQVHVHPGRAFHSSTDDGFAIVSTEGFLSLVLPRFAAAPLALEDAYLARIDGSGAFEPVPVGRFLEVGEG